MTVATIYTNNDSFAYEYNSGTNYDGDDISIWGRSGRHMYGYFGFDITSAPAASVIDSVDIFFYLRSAPATTRNGRFSRITGSWDESTLTWSNKPAVTTTNQVVRALDNSPLDAYYGYDITEIYKDAKNAGNTLGVRLIDNVTQDLAWHMYDSKDSGNDPKIVITYSTTDFYVKTTGDDAKTGTSWANAWKTINKAATTVVDGTTVHIGFGTYDAEPSANKIAPQNVGASGIYYLPETATTGGGTGTVSVEQNT